MKCVVSAVVIVTLLFGLPEVSQAQAPHKSGIVAASWAGGLLGTYSALVCSGKGNCTQKESWALIGIYSGAAIGGTFALSAVNHSKKPKPASLLPSLQTFSRVQGLVKPGDRIVLRDATGTRVEGKAVAVSDTRLQLRIGDSTRDFSSTEISSISQRRRVGNFNRLGRGVLVGLVAGAIVIPNTNSGRWCGGKGAGTCVLGAAALGGTLFGGVSFAKKREVTIFSQQISTRPTNIGVRVSPLISKDSKGAALSLTF